MHFNLSYFPLTMGLLGCNPIINGGASVASDAASWKMLDCCAWKW